MAAYAHISSPSLSESRDDFAKAVQIECIKNFIKVFMIIGQNHVFKSGQVFVSKFQFSFLPLLINLKVIGQCLCWFQIISNLGKSELEVHF